MTNRIVPQNGQGYLLGKKIRVFCCNCQANEAIYRDPQNRSFCIACYKDEDGK